MPKEAPFYRDVKQAVARQLRVLRVNSGKSPEDIAAQAPAPVTGNYIRRIEVEKYSPTVEILAALCVAYGTSLARFFESIEQEEDLAGTSKKETRSRIAGRVNA